MEHDWFFCDKMSYAEILHKNTNVPQTDQVANYTLVKSDTHKSCHIKKTRDQKTNESICQLDKIEPLLIVANILSINVTQTLNPAILQTLKLAVLIMMYLATLSLKTDLIH